MRAATFTTLLLSAAALVTASPLPKWNLNQPVALERSPADPDMADLEKRLVFNPTITSPKGGEAWTAGSSYSVTWNTDDIPDEAKDDKSKLMLGYLPADGQGGENLKWTLADGFPLTSGSVNFVLPTDVAARDDYIVVLFGDSGNASPKFSIKPAASNKASLRDDPATALTDLGSTITDAVLGADAAAPAA